MATTDVFNPFIFLNLLYFLLDSQVTEWEEICLLMQDIQVIRVQSLGQEDPLEEEMETHSSILSWEIYGQRSLAGYSP